MGLRCKVLASRKPFVLRRLDLSRTGLVDAPIHYPESHRTLCDDSLSLVSTLELGPVNHSYESPKRQSSFKDGKRHKFVSDPNL